MLTVLHRPERRCAYSFTGGGGGYPGTVRYATDATPEAIAVQIALSSPGDTVIVPEATREWTSTLTITKRIWLIGAGVGNTVITSNAGTPSDSSGSDEALIRYVPTDATSTDYFRLSGFTLDANEEGKLIYVYRSGTTPTYIRIDHNRIIGMTAGWGSQQYDGVIYGAIDHNIMENLVHIDFYGVNTDAWASLVYTPGTADNLFVEDNEIVNMIGTFDTIGDGGRACFRYNTFGLLNQSYSPLMDVHGNGTGVAEHSAMGAEIYGNYFSQPVTKGGLNMVDVRGGKNVHYFNWKAGAAANDYMRICEEHEDSYMAPYDVGIDGTPQRVNHSYFWNNRRKAAGTESIQYTDLIDVDDSIAPDVNYFLPTASFDGTSGVGWGTLAQRDAITPTTVGVGFWVTDQDCTVVTTAIAGHTHTTNITGTLYKWNGTTWEGTGLYAPYSPYTYPHPFTVE